MTENILDHPGIQQALFHPRPDYGRSGNNSHPIHIEVEPGVSIGGRLYPADAESPALLYYHGNGEIAADYDDLANFYTYIGLSLLVLDYRGYGTSTGEPSGSNLLSDAMAVFNQVGSIFAEYNLKPARLYVMGRSLGSVPAVETALHAGDQLAGLIIESGFSDTFGLLERLGVRVEGATEERDGFGNALKMQQISIPTLVLHGQRDILIPPGDGEALHANCAASEKTLVLIPGAGHNDIMMVGMQEYFQAVRQFVFPANP
jgi:hypothetical protein